MKDSRMCPRHQVKDEQPGLLSFHKCISSSRQFTYRIKLDQCTELQAATAQRNPLIKLHEDTSGQMNRGDLVSLQMKLEW